MSQNPVFLQVKKSKIVDFKAIGLLAVVPPVSWRSSC
jgi:hypothetical protein